MAEHSTVNRRVVGSSPTPGAGSSARPERALAVPATTRGTNSVPTQGPKRAAPSHRPRTVSLHAEWRRRPQDIPSLDMLTGMYANGEEVEPLVGMSSDRVLSSGDKALSLIDGRHRTLRQPPPASTAWRCTCCSGPTPRSPTSSPLRVLSSARPDTRLPRCAETLLLQADSIRRLTNSEPLEPLSRRRPAAPRSAPCRPHRGSGDQRLRRSVDRCQRWRRLCGRRWSATRFRPATRGRRRR
jgi:hypothetical protein